MPSRRSLILSGRRRSCDLKWHGATPRNRGEAPCYDGTNERLGKHLAMGHSAHVRNLVKTMRKNPNDLKILGKYQNLLLKYKD